jgi:chitin synthase
MSLIGFSLYAVVVGGDKNQFTRTYRVAELEEDELFHTVVVSMETETRWIRQRFVDVFIRTVAWAMVFALYCFCLYSKRPVFISATVQFSYYIVILTTGLWIAMFFLVEDDSPYEDSWVFDRNSLYQIVAMPVISILGIISLRIMLNSEVEDRASRRYAPGLLKHYYGKNSGSHIVHTTNPLYAMSSGRSKNSSTESVESIRKNGRSFGQAEEDPTQDAKPYHWPITYSSEVVAPQLFGSLPERGHGEFHDLRYTACTAGKPSDFWLNGYQLRAAQLKRPIEVLIAITSYNEEASEFERTLLGVNRNIQHLTKTEAADAWQKVAVVIIADGRSKVHPNTLRLLRVQGGYDRKQMEETCSQVPADFLRGYYQRRNLDDSKVNEIIEQQDSGQRAHFFRNLLEEGSSNESSPSYLSDQERKMLQRLSVENADPSTYATVHIFERSLQMIEDTNHEVFYQPMQTIFAMKERNGGKLDSHDWFFNGFAEHLQAKFCVLLDVGTIPQDRAIYKLYKAMYLDPTIGGCCGEISVHKPQLLNPIVASQHFEYKVANFMDKATESVFGFITVLPGAFSAYRYEAIRGEPLNLYFKSLTHPDSLGAFKGNMYLAEDRILCFELVARLNCAWTLRYIKNAVAETDVPETLEDLMKQRRRWLNGSTFALAYSVFNFNRIFGTSHTIFRKFCLVVQLAYYGLQLILTWFLPGVFFLAWYLLLEEFVEEENSLFGDFLQVMFGDLFAFMIFFQFIVAIANKVHDQKDFYTFTRFYFGMVSFLTVVLLVQQIGNSCDLFLRWSAIATSTFLFVCALLHGELYTMITTWIQYTSMVPVFLLAMQIYAICNTHDLSWGTKGLEDGGHAAPTSSSNSTAAALKNADKLRKEMAKKRAIAKRKEDHLKSFRFWAALCLLGCNVLLILMVTSVTAAREGYFNALFGILLLVTSYRFLGSTIYVSYTWHKKLAHWRKSLAYWIAYLRKPPYPRQLHHDGYKPRVFYNSSYDRQYASKDREEISCAFSDKSLETQKFTRVTVPIVMQSVLDRNDVVDQANLQWYAQPDKDFQNQALLES